MLTQSGRHTAPSDGLHTAPAPAVRALSVDSAGTESDAHGRIADGGGPESRLETHKRWSAGATRAERAGCKTVGSAYVGSNPTPANTCHHLRKQPASWEISARRAVSSLSRHVSPCRAAGRCVAVSTDV
jgi:hypothetical protein